MRQAPTAYDAVLSAEERAFRDDVVACIRGLPDLAPRQYFRDRGPDARRIYRQLGTRGWLSLCWPKAHGGAEAPRSYEFLLWDTLAYFRACRPDIGPGMIAHIVITNGRADLQARLLPGLAQGTLAMALGYSEPDSGSDLTHLSTRAVRDGDAYVVRGHKIWTSDAHHADKLWLLCRTGEDVAGSKGLSLLVVDMDSPGLTISPIPTIDGHQINEIFLDNVLVPVANRVGEEGEGWRMIRQALAVERHIQVVPGRIRRDLEDLQGLLEAEGLASQPGAVRALDELWAALAVVEASSLATVVELTAGGDAVRRAAQSKLLASRLCQRVPRVALDLLGPAGVVGDNDMAFLWRSSVLETIAGGTVEVMLSILAREGLGLGAGR